jgi:hypothetical protein
MNRLKSLWGGVNKNALLLAAIPLALCGATVLQFNQIQPPPNAPGLVSSTGTALGITTIGSGLSLTGGVLSTMSPAPVSSIPSITVTQVTSATQNSFPIPTGKTVCFVSRNIPQALGVDYTIQSGAVVFLNLPEPGDIVQLVCW